MLNKVDLKKGLSTEEVAKQKELGLQNNYEENVAKSTKDIISDNVMTLFNFLNFAIAVCLLFVGAYSNLAFLAIIIVNMSIGIFQEIHARNLVQKLSIVAKENVHVVRNGVQQEIDTKELVMEDIVIISAGEQVPSDMEVIDGKVEANEALLTGESDLIEKEIGDTLLSGSFIVSGQAYARVIHVGAENYAVKITQEAKVHKPIQSELVNSIRKVSKFTSWVIIPLGIILFVEAFWLRDAGIKTSVVASAAALLGMLPKGLVLLISIALTTGVIKLAKKRILVQDMYSIETLAHVDTLCLDKTGTITEGKMKVQKAIILHDKYEELFPQIIGSYLSESTDNNITMQAIRDHYEVSNRFGAKEVLAFSSERKWGAIEFPEIGTVYLGAPERLVDDSRLPEAVFTAQENGYRVLMLAIAEQQPLNETKMPYLEPLAILEIDDPIRQNAKETLAYLKEEGIDLKVISGDNPVTVSNIARRAGLPGYESYIDLSTKTTEAEVREAVQQYTVFGRVSPQQKRTIVRELKDTEHVVAMTGDGVNDVLALREADCSIAMAEGDGATRQISNLVLLDSDFTTLPDVLFEGRRVVNNVTRVSSVFFIKTIYSFILSIICALTAIAFPFIPIQVTLIDLAIEGYPAFFLSFEGDKRKVVGKFLPTALKNASVNALLVVANIIAVYLIGQNQGFSSLDTTTLMYYLLVGISCMAVVRACLPLNPLRIFLVFSTIIGIYVAAMLFHNILEIGFLTSQTMGLFFIMMAINIVVRVAIGFVQMKRTGKTIKDL
ncbi:TPA: cation-translocating P-type ATPase [Enterococcus faecalis]|uniref:cation-translocating P-type ATPase n=1 Tax=Enterococcus faecalis TaxID=1351 RepID=UPI001CEFBE8C|nr:cation-translocating P-type ATPase [Enterococcus faecalis]UNT39666.1 cation-translocating P-type ATPase [Enterococcus faecalis]HAP4450554.1 cation-translocating P-type ATPase [Enterococcus faecalis]HAP4453232.1 cation-translocating P-type ATPase [Enterococcus faecalis]HAP4900726.1 cation-translocating P-type ATPase [Enterococcus faecalis]HAP4903443.1 cation-translocating P-type ATPase [Enterococcus faecalis]